MTVTPSHIILEQEGGQKGGQPPRIPMLAGPICKPASESTSASPGHPKNPTWPLWRPETFWQYSCHKSAQALKLKRFEGRDRP
jgi:hypothetical protein